MGGPEGLAAATSREGLAQPLSQDLSGVLSPPHCRASITCLALFPSLRRALLCPLVPSSVCLCFSSQGRLGPSPRPRSRASVQLTPRAVLIVSMTGPLEPVAGSSGRTRKQIPSLLAGEGGCSEVGGLPAVTGCLGKEGAGPGEGTPRLGAEQGADHWELQVVG